MTVQIKTDCLYDRLFEGAESIQHAAIIEDETSWSYLELREKVNRLAGSLSEQGIAPGDKIALMLMNQKEFIVSFLAIRLLGGVVVPLNIQMPPSDLQFIIAHSESKLIITNMLFAKHFAESGMPLLVVGQPAEEQTHPSWELAAETGPVTFRPDEAAVSALKYPDLHVLIYTSGTTGQPKGVMLSEKNLMANMDGIDPVLNLQSSDKALLALPLFHAYGLMIGLYLMDKKGTMILVPNFAPKKIIEALIHQHVTILPLVPTMFGVMLQAMKKIGAEQFKSLRACVSGGASLPQQLLKDVETFLNVVVLEGYGMTETAPVLAVNNPKRGSIPGSVGKPLPNVTLKLVEGEIRVKGDNIMAGYYKNPEATKEAFDAEGFLRTGDLGHLDEEGNIFISGGRIKDLIIKAGENIVPLRIEQVLYQHPSVQDASVIGVPDAKLGEDVLACIQLKDEAKPQDIKAVEQELKKFCLEHLTPLLAPGYFRFYDELPKNATGKVLKKTLREDNPAPPAKN